MGWLGKNKPRSRSKVLQHCAVRAKSLSGSADDWWPLIERKELGKETRRPGYHCWPLVTSAQSSLCRTSVFSSVRSGSLRLKGTTTSDSLILGSIIVSVRNQLTYGRSFQGIICPVKTLDSVSQTALPQALNSIIPLTDCAFKNSYQIVLIPKKISDGKRLDCFFLK